MDNMSGHNGVVQMGMAMLQKEATPFVGLSIKMLPGKLFFFLEKATPPRFIRMEKYG